MGEFQERSNKVYISLSSVPSRFLAGNGVNRELNSVALTWPNKSTAVFIQSSTLWYIVTFLNRHHGSWWTDIGDGRADPTNSSSTWKDSQKKPTRQQQEKGKGKLDWIWFQWMSIRGNCARLCYNGQLCAQPSDRRILFPSSQSVLLSCITLHWPVRQKDEEKI